jgi:hypothetical protein
MENAIADVKQTLIDCLKEDKSTENDQDAETKARNAMSLAFTINSLMYSLLRVQGKV